MSVIRIYNPKGFYNGDYWIIRDAYDDEATHALRRFLKRAQKYRKSGIGFAEGTCTDITCRKGGGLCVSSIGRPFQVCITSDQEYEQYGEDSNWQILVDIGEGELENV